MARPEWNSRPPARLPDAQPSVPLVVELRAEDNLVKSTLQCYELKLWWYWMHECTTTAVT